MTNSIKCGFAVFTLLGVTSPAVMSIISSGISNGYRHPHPQVIDSLSNTNGGIRWFFHKKKLREIRLKRPVSWVEAVAEYKGRPMDSKEVKIFIDGSLVRVDLFKASVQKEK